jgi:hypothetical protein
MRVSERYPDYAAIESHIHRARIERSIYVSEMIVGAITAVIGGVKRLFAYAATQRRPLKPTLSPR